MAKRRRLDSYTDANTRAEKQAVARALSAQASADAMDALLTREGWEGFVRARVAHAGYSWRNAALIAHQAPDALQLATYSQWAAAGVSVRKGERSIVRIIGRGRNGQGFKSYALFDVTQTTMPPMEIERPPAEHETLVSALLQVVNRPTLPSECIEAGEALQGAYERATEVIHA